MLLNTRMIAIVAMLLLGACVNDTQGPVPVEPDNPLETLSRALEQSVDNSIIAAVDGFDAEMSAFDVTSRDFCTLLDEASLIAMQEQWRTVFGQWFRLSIYNFGPLDDDLVTPPYTFIDSLRLRGTNYLETVRSEISSDIAGDHELSDQYFSGKTFQRIGLLALEAAVFETSTAEHSQASVDIIAEYQLEARRCQILSGLTNQLVERSAYVKNGWSVSHQGSADPYRTLFLSDQLDDGTAPLNQLVLSVQEYLDYLQARSVVETAATLSQYSWQAIEATIDEVESLLEGKAQTQDSFFDVMELAGKQNEVAVVRDSLQAVKAAIVGRNVDMLETTLGFLDGNFKREIPDSLDIELGINFSDGD